MLRQIVHRPTALAARNPIACRLTARRC